MSMAVGPSATFQSAEPGQWFDPAVLRDLLGASVPVPLGEGEQRAKDLRVR